MSQRFEVTIAIDVKPTEDARFMDVDTPVRSRGPLGTHTCMPGRNLSGIEREVLFGVLRYTAANENVSEEWVTAGVKKTLRVPSLERILHCDFACALLAIFDVLGI